MLRAVSSKVGEILFVIYAFEARRGSPGRASHSYKFRHDSALKILISRPALSHLYGVQLHILFEISVKKGWKDVSNQTCGTRKLGKESCSAQAGQLVHLE